MKQFLRFAFDSGKEKNKFHYKWWKARRKHSEEVNRQRLITRNSFKKIKKKLAKMAPIAFDVCTEQQRSDAKLSKSEEKQLQKPRSAFRPELQLSKSSPSMDNDHCARNSDQFNAKVEVLTPRTTHPNLSEANNDSYDYQDDRACLPEDDVAKQRAAPHKFHMSQNDDEARQQIDDDDVDKHSRIQGRNELVLYEEFASHYVEPEARAAIGTVYHTAGAVQKLDVDENLEAEVDQGDDGGERDQNSQLSAPEQRKDQEESTALSIKYEKKDPLKTSVKRKIPRYNTLRNLGDGSTKLDRDLNLLKPKTPSGRFDPGEQSPYNEEERMLEISGVHLKCLSPKTSSGRFVDSVNVVKKKEEWEDDQQRATQILLFEGKEKLKCLSPKTPSGRLDHTSTAKSIFESKHFDWFDLNRRTNYEPEDEKIKERRGAQT